MVKTRINEFVQKAKARPATAASDLAILLELLEAFANDRSEPYVELRDTAKELQGMYQREAPKQQIEGQLQKLVQQAAALPG